MNKSSTLFNRVLKSCVKNTNDNPPSSTGQGFQKVLDKKLLFGIIFVFSFIFAYLTLANNVFAADGCYDVDRNNLCICNSTKEAEACSDKDIADGLTCTDNEKTAFCINKDSGKIVCAKPSDPIKNYNNITNIKEGKPITHCKQCNINIDAMYFNTCENNDSFDPGSCQLNDYGYPMLGYIFGPVDKPTTEETGIIEGTNICRQDGIEPGDIKKLDFIGTDICVNSKGKIRCAKQEAECNVWYPSGNPWLIIDKIDPKYGPYNNIIFEHLRCPENCPVTDPPSGTKTIKFDRIGFLNINVKRCTDAKNQPTSPCTLWGSYSKNGVPAPFIDYRGVGYEYADGICKGIYSGFGITLQTEPAGFIQTVFGLILSLAGGITLLIIIYSGYRLMMSRGNPEKIQGAKETITSAIVGLLFIIFAMVILEFIGVDVLGIFKNIKP